MRHSQVKQFALSSAESIVARRRAALKATPEDDPPIQLDADLPIPIGDAPLFADDYESDLSRTDDEITIDSKYDDDSNIIEGNFDSSDTTDDFDIAMGVEACGHHNFDVFRNSVPIFAANNVTLPATIDADQPLYEGSRLNLGSYIILLLEQRNSHGSMGDEQMFSQAKLDAIILPRPNQLECIVGNRRHFVRICLQTLRMHMKSLPIYCVDICSCGYFAGSDTVCPSCHEHRYVEGTQKPVSRSYYLPVRERIEQILNSFISNLLQYPELRVQSHPDMVRDVFDTEEYNRLLQKIPDGHKLICIGINWDGTLVFRGNRSKSMWPLNYCIFNLPPPLRMKMHVGMHMAFLDVGSRISCDILALELDDLWVNPIVCNGTAYHVAVLAESFDGRGFEKYYCVQGGGSCAGCPKCKDFNGISISRGRVVFEGMRRNLPRNDPMRRASTGKHSKDAMFYASACNLPPSIDRSYDEYLRDGREALRTGRSVNGVKELSPTALLPYAEDIMKPFDAMHAVYNSCWLCLSILRPDAHEHPNRSTSAAALDYEKERGRFGFIDRNLGACWVLDKWEADLCDRRLAAVKSVDRLNVPVAIFGNMGGQNSHAIITFCTLYARYCLEGLGNQIHMNCILDLFDVIRIVLCEPRQIKFNNDTLVPHYIKLVSQFEGLFPASECTYAFHQLYHVVKDVYPIRQLWMFPYERNNKYYKSLCKNKASPIASIISNYQLQEHVHHMLVCNRGNACKLQNILGEVGRSDHNVVSNFFEKLKYIHADKDGIDFTLHMTTSSNIIDIRGDMTWFHLSSDDKYHLWLYCAENAEEGTLLYELVLYFKSTLAHNAPFAISVFLEWLESCGSIPTQLRQYRRHIRSLTWILDWDSIKKGFPDSIAVHCQCMLAGNVITCAWFNSYTVDKPTLDTFASISALPKASRGQLPCILGHHLNDCCIQYGMPRFFFRLSFTSAYENVAMCYLRNIKAKPKKGKQSAYSIAIHGISEANWRTGPSLATRGSKICPFVKVGDMIPSRYALAAENQTRLSFIPLDYELVDFVSHGRLQYTDFGDNVINQHPILNSRDDDDNGINDDGLSKLLSGSMWEFLNADLLKV